jgi:hypothetical protein
MKFDLEYNARSLAPTDVARSFIPPEPSFGKLFSKNHALIVGPRGSGKTTLLKMLTVRALQHWDHPEAAEYARQITFNAAFIPADIAWGKQIEALDLNDGESERQEAAFVLHCVRGLVRAMREAIELGRSEAISDHVRHLAVNMTSATEAEFAVIASKILQVEPLLPTTLGLEIGLERELNRAAISDVGRFSHSTLPTIISALVTAFNGLATGDERRWALLVDELEIAPTKVKQFLLSGVRGFDERIIVKLAMAPYMEDAQFGESPTSPHPLHDYQTIPLTYSNKSDAEQFTKILIKSTFQRLGFEVNYPEEIFQRPKNAGFGYARPNMSREKRIPDEFISLARKDESFANYLDATGVLEKDYKFSENRVAQDIRKVIPIVVARDYYVRRFDVERRVATIRARKSYGLYTGYPSVAEITEGNPRAILTLVTPLAQEQHLRALNNSKIGPISTGSQANAIRRVELLLSSLLQVIPLDMPGFDKGKGLLDFIDQIGHAFESRLLKGPFKADYVGTFRLDLDASDEVKSAVGKALNAGALIHVPSPGGSSDTLLRGLAGQRFRVSYALAPRYSLLLTLGDFIWLSTLLRDAENAEVMAAQSSLFHDGAPDEHTN